MLEEFEFGRETFCTGRPNSPSPTERLIALVRQHRILYDSNVFDYYNLQKRTIVWQEVAEHFGKPVTECKKQWNAIRCSFIRGLRTQRKTRFSEQLSFLLPFSFVRKKKEKRPSMRVCSNTSLDGSVGCLTNVEGNVSEEIEEIYIEEDNIEIHDNSIKNEEDHLHNISLSNSPMLIPMREHPVENSLINKRQEKKPTEQQFDHLSTFFKAMEQLVRTFPPGLQATVKGEIFRVVNDAELKNLTQT